MSHTFDPNVLKSIIVGVEYSKVIVDLENTMIFHLMTLPWV